MGNYSRLINGEFFSDEPTPEQTELQIEADKYFAELAEWIEAVKNQEETNG